MSVFSEDSVIAVTKELSLYSYETENKREQSLLDQAGKMLMAISVFTVALLAFISLEVCDFKKNQILLISAFTFLPLGFSFILSIRALWRHAY